jgi:hypothetical protein
MIFLMLVLLVYRAQALSARTETWKREHTWHGDTWVTSWTLRVHSATGRST